MELHVRTSVAGVSAKRDGLERTVQCQPVHQISLVLAVLKFALVKKITLNDVTRGLGSANARQVGPEKPAHGLVRSTSMVKSVHKAVIVRMEPFVIPLMEAVSVHQDIPESSVINLAQRTSMAMIASLIAAARILSAVHTSLENAFVSQDGKVSSAYGLAPLADMVATALRNVTVRIMDLVILYRANAPAVLVMWGKSARERATKVFMGWDVTTSVPVWDLMLKVAIQYQGSVYANQALEVSVVNLNAHVDFMVIHA